VRIPQWVLLGVVPAFLAANCMLAVLGIVSDHAEYFWLSFIIGTPFVVGLMMAASTRAPVLIVFAIACLVSGWITPLGFFLEREHFEYSGFSAVRDFDFSVTTFIGYYIPVVVGYGVIICIAAVPLLLGGGQLGIRSSREFSTAGREAVGRVTAFLQRPGRRRNQVTFRALFLVLIVLFSATNWWMYNQGIGLTGIAPPRLPFRLSGILYYTARFVFPIALTYVLTRFRPSWPELFLVVVYACFAALTSVSRTVLVLLFLPVFVICFAQRRYVVAAFAGVALSIAYPLVALARNFVYVIDAGISMRNLNVSIPDMIAASASLYRFDGLLAGPLALVARVGGAQDVVLAAQFPADFEGSVQAFIRLYIFDFWGVAREAQRLMYAYAPETIGFATGDGGFFAHMLLVSSGSWLVLFLVAAYCGLLLSIANDAGVRFSRMGVPGALVLLYSILFCVFFFALSIPVWTNVFLLIAVVASRSPVLKSLFRWCRSRAVFAPQLGEIAPAGPPRNGGSGA
jgi:hypothetical protein